MRQDMMLRAYKAARAMEPIALLDDYVRLITNQATYIGKVDYFESIPPEQWIDFTAAAPFGPLAVAAAIAAGTTAPKANITRLDLSNDEFGQWRWFPLDIMHVQLWTPAGVPKWQMKDHQVGIDHNIIFRDATLITTEFNSFQDQRPAMTPTNYSAYALRPARIIGFGYRFHYGTVRNGGIKQDIEDGVRNGSLPSTPVICAGYVGSTPKL